MSIIDTAVQWAVGIANDDSYKYVWGGWGKASGGYDCGHFVIDAYTKAGINVKGAGATSTNTMAKAFMKCGFKDVKGQVNLSTGSGLLKGDVLLNSAKHAALVQRDGGTTVEAWCTKGGIVAGKAYRNDGWDYVLRYPENSKQSVTSTAPPAKGTISGVAYGQNADRVFNNAKYGTYKPYFEKYGKKWNVDPNLLAALAMQESGLRDITTGPARGVTQIEYVLCQNANEGLPDGWLSFAAFGKAKYGTAWTLDDRNDKDKAIDFAAWLLDKSITYYNGDLRKAIQSYNYSHYTVDALIKSYGDAWFTSGRAVKTRVGYGDGQYVEHVFRFWRPNNITGRYASSDELYMYSANSVSTEEKEATVVWNNRTAENIFQKLQSYPAATADSELRVYANGHDITAYIGDHSWKNSLQSLATTMSFKTAKTDARYISNLIYVPQKADIIQMTTDKEIYRGVVISVDDGSDDYNSYSVVDLGWYLNKSKQTYQFKGITVTDVIGELCRDLSINIVMIPELSTVVNKIYFDKNIADIIKDLLSLCPGEYNYDFTPEGLRIYMIGDLTAIGEYLDRKVAEQGISRNLATYAKGVLRITGTPGSVILQGAKAATDSMLFSVDETAEIPDTGTVDVAATCIIEGSAGNVAANSITRFPVTLPGLTSVTNPSAFTGGYDAESDADLLERYLEKVSRPNVSGNKYHYISCAKEVSGVGDVQVIPLWNGPGTVKVVIVDSEGQPAGDELISDVREYINECKPIGADVTVESAASKVVNISAFIETELSDFDALTVKISAAVSAYLADEATAKIYVSYAKVCAAIMSVDGVDDCISLRFVNDSGGESTSSFRVPEGYIPVLGELNLSEDMELHIAI